MRAKPIYILALTVALALTGCSVATGASGSPASGTSISTPAPAAATSTATGPSGTTQAPSASGSQAPVATPDASDPTVAAIQAVIQKADQEQQTAFTSGDPTVMMDTATASYYQQLVQINSDMANGGVASIKLLKIEWGPIQVTSPTTATATSFETWSTVFSDSSTDQSRDQNDYTLVLDQGVWKIQADTNSGSAPMPAGGSSASVPPSSPSSPVPPAAGAPAGQTDISSNWSGYASTSGTFTAVTGTWTVPQSQAFGTLASGATWVGIGGVQTQDLIQAGTEETTNGTGSVQYDAWIETLPQSSRRVPLVVSPGDSVTVSISQQSTDQWLVEIKNQTTGEDYQTKVQYASSLSSAEWIEEAPTAGRRLLPIDNFGTVQFTAGSAVKDGKTVTIGGSGAQPITMGSPRGGVLATPSVLSSDGQGFTVSRTSSGTAPSTVPGSAS